MMKITPFPTLHELAERLASGATTSEAICRDAFAAIDRGDGEVKAFLKIDRERVLAAARAADERRKNGAPLSEFDGIPVGIKDNIAVADETVSCASKILEPVVSPYDATVIAKLKAKGIIPFGRLNMDEFAMVQEDRQLVYRYLHLKILRLLSIVSKFFR